jgi:dihydrofolate reductase
MRRVRFSVAVSLDGYIAGPGDDMGWLIWSDDAGALAGEHWRDFDTVLLGRKTYAFAAKSGQTEGDPGGIRSYIFSRTLTASPSPNADLVRDDAAGFVRALKGQPGKDILLMGGGELFVALLAGGVIDEIGLNLHPVLLGGGAPLFPNDAGKPTLDLVESRPLAKGCVWLKYRPAAA